MNLEDLQEGDLLRCREGNNCCFHDGREYEVIKSGNRLCIRTDCGLTSPLIDEDVERFEHITKGGPW